LNLSWVQFELFSLWMFDLKYFELNTVVDIVVKLCMLMFRFS